MELPLELPPELDAPEPEVDVDPLPVPEFEPLVAAPLDEPPPLLLPDPGVFSDDWPQAANTAPRPPIRSAAPDTNPLRFIDSAPYRFAGCTVEASARTRTDYLLRGAIVPDRVDRHGSTP
jgi:hypothetical protein